MTEVPICVKCGHPIYEAAVHEFCHISSVSVHL